MALISTDYRCPACTNEIDDNDFLSQILENEVSVMKCDNCKKYIRGYSLEKNLTLFISGGKCLEKDGLVIDSSFISQLMNEMKEEIHKIKNWFFKKDSL